MKFLTVQVFQLLKQNNLRKYMYNNQLQNHIWATKTKMLNPWVHKKMVEDRMNFLFINYF